MRTHQQIDERSLEMARAIVKKIDDDPERCGFQKARETCTRWFEERREQATAEWMEILQQPWETVREILLGEAENNKRLRQSSPFCGILTPPERWHIYERFREAH